MGNENFRPNQELEPNLEELSLAEHETRGPDLPPQWEPDDAEKMRKVAEESQAEFEDRINDEKRGYDPED